MKKPSKTSFDKLITPFEGVITIFKKKIFFSRKKKVDQRKGCSNLSNKHILTSYNNMAISN